MRRSIFILVLALACLPACKQGQRDADTTTQATQRAANMAIAPGIWSVDSGKKLTETQLWDALADHRFVVVGESHGQKWHHRVQAQVYRAMLARHGSGNGAVALGMEMFQRPYQAPLAAYAKGKIDQTEMLERTEWDSRWGLDPALYSPLWKAARANNAPIVALNASRELSGRVAEVGLEELPAAERARLPDDIDTTNQAHRKLVREAFGKHSDGMSDATFERFYQAQVAWDETMAAAAVRFMDAHPKLPAMVLVCGRFHAYAAFGIPPRIEKRLSSDSKGADSQETDPAVTLLPITPETPEASMDLETIRQQNLADYVWIHDGS